MPKYVIERTVPGAGQLSEQELKAIARRSCDLLSGLGPQIQWLESYVTDDKLFCVYLAPSPELIRRHGHQGGFPIDRIAQVRAVIGPVNAD
jgi:hypothetical protein